MRREEHPNIINNKEKEDGYQLSANVFQEESEMKVWAARSGRSLEPAMRPHHMSCFLGCLINRVQNQHLLWIFVLELQPL